MDADRLASTWQQVHKLGDEVPLFFYSHLFVVHPEARDMFPLTMNVQRDRFFAALGHIVSRAAHVEELTEYVEQLGRDHRRFDVVADHYDVVGGSLLWTLKHFLGDAWTPEVAKDWAEAYGLVAGIMVGAADEAAEEEPPWWDAKVVEIARLSRELAVIRVAPETPVPYRSGQSMSVTTPHVPQMWRYLTPANAPRSDGGIEFHVSAVPGGLVSRQIVTKTRPGSVFRLAAPVGTALTIDPAADNDLLMVAGGTGLAPFLALLDDIAAAWREGRTKRRVHLVHGARMSWHLHASRRLADLAAANPGFTFTETVSDDPSFPGPRGMVGDVAASVNMPGPYDALVCGSPEMTEHTTRALKSASRPPQSIVAEEFAYGAAQTPPGTPSITSGVETTSNMGAS